MHPTEPQALMNRRDAIKAGAGILGLLFANTWLSACVGQTPSTGAGPLASGSSAVGGSPPPQATGSAGAWASGGTKAMKATYPDPFLTQPVNPATTCGLTCTATLGPCHAESPERQDISEGQGGLPMRMSFQVVKADGCTPIEGASVEVWHTNAGGIYSAYPKGSMCNPDSEEAAAAKYFRGQLKTDAQGRVDFHSVYPGWYSSRTVHVHFTVRVGGQEHVTSQFVFDDALSDEIYTQHPEYNARPKRSTTNANDTVVSAASAAAYSFASLKASDGVLQVWKTIALRSSLDQGSCAIPGGSGGGGMAPGGAGPMGSPPPRP